MSAWCRFASDDLWNAVVRFQPPSLLIGKVWVPVMHFCSCRIHCKVHWGVSRRLGSYRLISMQPLIWSTIREFCIGFVLWVLEVLCCLYWHSFYQICQSTLWWTVVGVNGLTSCQECHWAVFWAWYYSSYTFRSFFSFWRISWSVMSMTPLISVVPSPGIRVTVADSLSRDLVKVSKWCDLWGIKLNASKTKTIIVSRSRTMYPQPPALTILAEGVRWPCYFGSDIWVKDDCWEASLLCFQSSFWTA